MSELVEDLELWLDAPAYVDTGKRGREIDRASWLIQRARDEIVALREKASRLERGLLDEWGTKLIAKARAEALEKAARVAERWQERPEFDKAAAIAAAIRALKR